MSLGKVNENPSIRVGAAPQQRTTTAGRSSTGGTRGGHPVGSRLSPIDETTASTTVRRGPAPARTSASRHAQDVRPQTNDLPWPAGRIDLAAEFVEHPMMSTIRELQSLGVHVDVDPRLQLSTIGRPLPPVIPQTVGRDFEKPIGEWTEDRTGDVFKNLHKLAETPAGPDQEQLHLEISLRWHALCEVEQRNVLDALGSEHAHLLGDTAKPSTDEAARTPVRDWLEHTMGLGTDRHQIGRLFRELRNPAAANKLSTSLHAANTEAGATMLRARFTNLRFEQAMDDGVDYGGFMERTNRVYATLPKEKVGMKVIVVGGGTTGITAADGLNRMGAKPLVLEQADQIGGRAKTIRTTRADGRESPTKVEAGGMRANLHNGNPLTYMVKRYAIKTEVFGNPGVLPTVYDIDGKVRMVEARTKPTDPLMLKANELWNKHVERAVFDPIRRARDAGDTAKFFELTEALAQKTDNMDFREFVSDCLRKGGVTDIKPDLKRMIDAHGIGVGTYLPYYDTSALEEVRFTVNERVEKHKFFPEGFDTPLRKMVADDEFEPGKKGGMLPSGVPFKSLKEQGAIRLGAEVTDVRKPNDGPWEVSYTDKKTGEKKVETGDDVIWAAPQFEAKFKGITDIKGPDELQLVETKLHTAMQLAQQTGATKLAVKIPIEAFRKAEEKGLDLGVCLQTVKGYQQSYVLPEYPAEIADSGKDTGPAQSRVMFVSYNLGSFALKDAGLSGEEKFANDKRLIRNAQHAEGDEKGKEIMKALADALDLVDPKDIYHENWLMEKHFYAAFKMDAPGDRANTRLMEDSVLKGSDMKGLLIGNEFMSSESGFVRGGYAMGINLDQKLAVRHGGTLPPNSPFEQRRLTDITSER